MPPRVIVDNSANPSLLLFPDVDNLDPLGGRWWGNGFTQNAPDEEKSDIKEELKAAV